MVRIELRKFNDKVKSDIKDLSKLHGTTMSRIVEISVNAYTKKPEIRDKLNRYRRSDPDW
tara:strand:- start:6829 stop:7008 length:180 start_codon:yes stop_codon:yes gene_type:complete